MRRKWLEKIFCLMIVAAAASLLLIQAPAAADVIIDNGGPGTSFVGTWAVSGGALPYGANSLWARNGATYTFRMDSQAAGTYEVFMWWSGLSSRSPSVPVAIEHEGQVTSLTIDQSRNNGRWNSLGRFNFSGSGRVTITAANGSNVSTCADAVWFQQVSGTQPPSTDIIIDNRAPQTSRTGTWSSSSAPGFYGADSVWARNGATFTWRFTPPQTGNYDLSMWWTEWASRGTSIPVAIQHAQGTATIRLNQQVDGGQWNHQGTYLFNQGSTYSITMTSLPHPASTCADAVRFALSGSASNIAPSASIDSISPNPAEFGQQIAFVGRGSDPDGSIAAYRWVSDRDGEIGTSSSFSVSDLSAGTHTITLVVTDNEGALSSEAVADLIVEPAAADEMIIDNRDAETSRTGTWNASSSAGFYGVDSVWSRGGSTYTWFFTPTASGLYDISMWWTQWTSRSTSIPVRIQHALGSTTVTINQQLNGGRWNSLGSYSLQADTRYSVVITSQASPSSTCADAVRYMLLGPMPANLPPVAANDTAATAAGSAVNINVAANDRDPDGTLNLSSVAVSSAPGHGTAVSQGNGSITYSPAAGYTGADTFRYRISDNSGAQSNEATVSVSVQAANDNEEHIFACFGFAVDDTCETNTVETLSGIGASLHNGVWTYEARGKRFLVHLVRDVAGMKQALMTRDAHVLFQGHSNYGLGSVFATPAEFRTQVVEDIYYLDDDRIFNCSSPWIGVSIRGMRDSQAYPNWWPIFKDGTSAIMPYQFDEPYQDPPYNYYITYQVPGDPTHYRMETARNAALERFAGCERPAWYSADGRSPNPDNPDHWQYYITLPDPWYPAAEWEPSFELVGEWTTGDTGTGHFHQNYYYSAAGTGARRAVWSFEIPVSGRYTISAWWPASSLNAVDAPYRIENDGGAVVATVRRNQRESGGRWVELGTFDLNSDQYAVSLTDDVASGRVVADAVRVEHADNPSEIIKAAFNARNRNGLRPLEVVFDGEEVGEVQNRTWNFGDGQSADDQSYVLHTYTAAGTYPVSYTVSGPLGTDTASKTRYITVGSTTPVLQSEFSAETEQEGQAPFTVTFGNRSSGDILSWRWEFGDGGTSSAQNPTHTYSAPGLYDVRLTVTDNRGASVSETKQSFIRVVVYDKSVDNVVNPAAHYGGRTILFRKQSDIAPQEMQYKRLLYISCTSGLYYTDTFQRGIMFYTLSSSWAGEFTLPLYLKGYLEGLNDEQIWRSIQGIEPLYDYYDFSKRPSEQ